MTSLIWAMRSDQARRYGLGGFYGTDWAQAEIALDHSSWRVHSMPLLRVTGPPYWVSHLSPTSWPPESYHPLMYGSVIVSDSSWAASFAIAWPPLLKGLEANEVTPHP